MRVLKVEELRIHRQKNQSNLRGKYEIEEKSRICAKIIIFGEKEEVLKREKEEVLERKKLELD